MTNNNLEWCSVIQNDLEREEGGCNINGRTGVARVLQELVTNHLLDAGHRLSPARAERHQKVDEPARKVDVRLPGKGIKKSVAQGRAA